MTILIINLVLLGLITILKEQVPEIQLIQQEQYLQHPIEFVLLLNNLHH